MSIINPAATIKMANAAMLLWEENAFSHGTSIPACFAASDMSPGILSSIC